MPMTSDQHEKLQHDYPEAAAFILRCELENEYTCLKNARYTLNNWQQNRLNELDELYKGRLYHENF